MSDSMSDKAPMSDIAERKEKVARASVFASAAITLGKLAAGLATGSLALISEAGHALVDTGATIMTWFAVRVSERPADDDHHYGHGKLEALAALIETGLLFGLSGAVLIEGARRLWSGGGHVEAKPIAFVVLIASIIIDALRWRALKKAAEETKSDALAADALHFSSDLVGSALVLIGLVFVLLGFPQADALASFGVAGFVGYAGYKLARQTIDTLLDAAPEGLSENLRKIAADTPGVAEVEFIRLRPVGAQVFGELGIIVPRTLSLERVSALKARLAEAIAQAAPGAQITLSARAGAMDDETIQERVMLAAARRRAPIHHVFVQRIGERISVSLDLEIDGRQTMGQAHETASRLESAIRDELGDSIEVETHIEPLETSELEGLEAPAAQSAAIEAALNQLAAEEPRLQQIHNVRVRTARGGLYVNYHCRVDAETSVAVAHDAVDSLERKVRAAHPEIMRIVGHAEPLTGKKV
jgi:cation diffusion facilitator family transporter